MKVCASTLCPKAGKRQPLENFYYHGSSYDRLTAMCKDCSPVRKERVKKEPKPKKTKGPKLTRRDYDKKWLESDPDYHRRRHYKTCYRLEGELLERALSRTEPCQICGSLEKVVVDHCHDTEQFRGFLCQPCNVSLGFMKESPDNLRKLADYAEYCLSLK